VSGRKHNKIKIDSFEFILIFSGRLMLRHLLKKKNQTAAKQAHSLSREIGKNLKKSL
jgi:hypothetical protein